MTATTSQPKVALTPVGRTGDGAAAEAMRQVNPDVSAVFPITPQTEIMENFAQFVADGKVETQLIRVESEHSAMSACMGAVAAGGRTMTCTSSQGLAYMHEALYAAAGTRLPMVMAEVNRTLSTPINIHGDHSDSIGSRDCGWLQLFCLDAQEVYDYMIMAVKISEAADVMLPVMVNLDGFVVSHDMERVEMLPDEEVKKFIGPFEPGFTMLDKDHPITIGSLVGPPFFFEHKLSQIRAIEAAIPVIKQVGAEYGALVGRKYDTIDSYMMDDAEIAVVVLGSSGGTCRVAVDRLRAQGVKAGVLRIIAYRPFPIEDVVAQLVGKKAVAVLDRASAPGAVGAPLFNDVCTALYDVPNRPAVVNYVFGLGGRDFTVEQALEPYTRLQSIASTGVVGPMMTYLGVRE